MTSLFDDSRLLIDGTLVHASDGGTYDNVNPATEQVIGVAADATDADVDAAVAAARRAFDDTSWSTDHQFRARCLRQLHAGLEQHKEELRQMVIAEVGAPFTLTFGPQLDIPVAGVPYAAQLAETYAWRQDLGVADTMAGPSNRYLLREPTGVVAAIVPWNFPIQIELAKAAPALAAGCTVVLKGAPATPWSASVIGRIVAEETDIPAGVLNVITSARNSAGQRLVEHPWVDLVSFTGSTATGRAIMAAAAPTLKRVFLELGGKSAMVVLDDADMALAAMFAAYGITTHAGQGCAINTRAIVPRARTQEFLDQMNAMLDGIAYGDPTDPSVMMGPLCSEAQRERVLGYIQSARDDGGTIVRGGRIPASLPVGYFVEPTVITGLAPEAKAVREEIFGPVLVVQEHDGEDHAVALANDSIYGLSGAVLSADHERAGAVAKRLRTGTVSVNGGLWYGADVPFGGYKQSGVGRESGVAGFEEYLEIKALAEPVQPS